VLVRESCRAGCQRGASENIDLNESRVDEGLEGVPDLAPFFIDCDRRRACGLPFDDQQAQRFTPFVHPLSRHCGEADHALARSMRRVKFSYERRNTERRSG
jgi:hypothetical protein